MFKIFDEPRPYLTQREVCTLYPNKAYALVNMEEIMRGDVHCGFKGELYAISDIAPEDMDNYYTATQHLEDIGSPVGVFNCCYDANADYSLS